MHFTSLVLQAALAIVLATNVIATPQTLYRCDQRSPNTIRKAGGFKAWNYGSKYTFSLDLLEKHVKRKLVPNKNPFIATSEEKDQAKKHCLLKGYLYTIDSSKITKPIHDVNKELADRTTGYEYEKEFAVEEIFPYAAVTSVESKADKGSPWAPWPPPKRRSRVIGEEEFDSDLVAEE